MKRNKNILFIVSFIIILLLAILIFFIMNKEELIHINYNEFNNKVENGEIKTVIIEANKVKFQNIENENLWYYTENPHYDGFEEKLLLNEVEVKNTATGQNIAFIIDLIFYMIFFAIIGFIIIKFIKSNGDTFKVIKHTNVKFDNIAGMEELKREMKKTVEILKNPQKYKKEGIRPTKGIILEGPPGNGKTIFAKALAEETDIKFIATRGADFQSAMMSMGSRKIKALFKKARKNKPCIIFIDEFDGIGERRSYAGTGVDKENNRIITAMLNEMDGFEQGNGILVIAATNSYDSLDSALIRPGRFDLKFTIGNPDFNTRIKLIEIYTKNKVLEEYLTATKLAETFENLSCSAIETILNEASMTAKLANRGTIAVEDIIIAVKKTKCNANLRKLMK